MALTAKHLFFLLFVVFFTCFLQVEARESKFFSKVTHYRLYSTDNNGAKSKVSTLEVPAAAPGPVVVSAPAPGPVAEAPQLSQNGYGLYGHDSSEFEPVKTKTSTTTTTTTNGENDYKDEEFDAETFKEFEIESKDTKYINRDDFNNYKTSGYSNYYNNKRYSSYNYNNDGYSKNNVYNNKGYSTDFNNNGNEAKQLVYSTNYNNKGYETEQKGMSDTRFLDNGRYFHDITNENYNPSAYESRRGSARREDSYGNNQNPNEFESMEEYYKSQGEYQENPEQYVP